MFRRPLPILALLGALPATAAAAVAPAADVLFTLPGGLPVKNSLLTSVFFGSLIVLVIRAVAGTPSLVPSRGQATVELIYEGMRDLIGGITGKAAAKVAFPVLLAVFLWIVLQNWSGLLPGVGSIGWGDSSTGSFKVHHALIRPANSDWNGTIALATVSMGLWLYCIMKFAGPRLVLFDLFGNKSDRKEIGTPMWLIVGAIFLVVGVIEVVSIAIRPFTLSVRLFGNVFGGENLLHSTGNLFVFLFMELLVGFVQALVFILLSSVYIGLICNHGDDHGEEEGHH